ncbi:MAG: ThuA domain-containing protein [Verrucomicrobiales bacterium]
MKPSKFLLALLVCALGAAILVAPRSHAANKDKKKPKTWEERRDSTLVEPTAEEKTLIADALPAHPTAAPKKARRILVFWRCETFIHKSIPFGNHALLEMGAKTGAWETDLAQDYAVFTPKNLANYDAVVFNNTTSLVFENDAQRAALMDFVKSGKGIVGIHAASDSFYQWEEASSMIGGQFNGHPWTQNGNWAFKLDDAAHPLNKAFAGKGFWHKDEIYWYKPETFAGKNNLRLLVSLDMARGENQKALDNKKYQDKAPADRGTLEVPVSWLREFAGGRIFYTNLGHRNDTYWQPAILQHYLDGIQYALGDLAADATPSAKAKGLKIADAPPAPPVKE